MSHEHDHSCHCTDAANCCSSATPVSLNWQNMLELSCKHLNAWAVYGNYTGSTEDLAEIENLCAKFFRWCDNHGIEQEKAHKLVQQLMFGHAALFDSAQQAGTIYRFFDEPGILGSPWFACLVSPTEGIIEENAA